MVGCPDGHFLCQNQKCLRAEVMCDGRNDCGDNSDEEKGCFGNKYFLNKNWFVGKKINNSCSQNHLSLLNVLFPFKKMACVK